MKQNQVILTFLFLISGAFIVNSQDLQITKSTVELVIHEMAQQLKSDYVFPDVADKMANSIVHNLKNGAYDSLLNPNELATRLSKDLYSISKDNHIRVKFDPERNKDLKGSKTNEDPEPEVLEKWKDEEMKENFGFSKVEILDGNIGFITLNGFSGFMDEAGKIADAAMAYVSNTDAIIFDLRSNPGGSPDMIKHLSSYLFKEATHINSFYFRLNDTTTENWTSEKVNGKKMDDIPAYVLMSERSYSASEEFAYNLKHLNRATVIGEISGGAANPGGYSAIGDNFILFIPTGRAINPITKTNWEGIGVIPHIEVPKENALEIAHIEALQEIAKTAKEKEKHYLEILIENKKALAEHIQLSIQDLERYTGEYGSEKLRLITIENESLYIISGGVKKHLTPIGDHLFLTDDNVRIRFNIESNNKISSLNIMIPNGPSLNCLRR